VLWCCEHELVGVALIRMSRFRSFWLDPGDGILYMAAAMQAEARALAHACTAILRDLGQDKICNERVWSKAIHRIVTDGISREQAVDEAIARMKQILSELRTDIRACLRPLLATQRTCHAQPSTGWS
jgi:hypothetical protein